MPPKQQDIDIKKTASMSGYQKKKKKANSFSVWLSNLRH